MRVLFANIGWSNTGANNPDDMMSLGNFTRQWYLDGSYGKAVLDPTVTPPIVLPLAIEQVTGYQWFYPSPPPQLLAAGYDQTAYDKVCYITPRVGAVGYKGLNVGKWSWINCGGTDYARHSTLHELGHSFGLSHAGLLKDVGAKDGNVYNFPPLSVSTGLGAYDSTADNCSTMGYIASLAHFSGPEKAQLGWITHATYDGGDRTYTLTQMEQPNGALYAVKVSGSMFLGSSRRVYWFENRRMGWADGIQMRMGGDFNCYPWARYVSPLKAYPEVGMLPGERFTDGSIVVDVVAADTIRIRPAAVADLPPAKPTQPLNVVSVNYQ